MLTDNVIVELNHDHPHAGAKATATGRIVTVGETRLFEVELVTGPAAGSQVFAEAHEITTLPARIGGML